MEKNRSGQGRSEEQIACNEKVMSYVIKAIGIALYIAICYQIANYMITH